jgi:hypothetical protein
MKIMSTLFYFWMLGLPSFAVEDVGFQSGKFFTAIPLRGTLHVSCFEGSKKREVTLNCFNEILSSEENKSATGKDTARERDYFVGPKGVDADQIYLTVVRPDQTQRSQMLPYLSNRGRSSEGFNLWFPSLGQMPLLSIGVNTVTFQMSKRGRVVSTGNFDVTVARGEIKQCSELSVNSANLADCDYQYTMCSQYFEENNFCQD